MIIENNKTQIDFPFNKINNDLFTFTIFKGGVKLVNIWLAENNQY